MRRLILMQFIIHNDIVLSYKKSSVSIINAAFCFWNSNCNYEL